MIAELIDLISMQDIHPDNGLNEIKFSNLYRKVEELDEGVLDQLIPLSKKLTKLTVSRMYSTSAVNRQALLCMIEKILHLKPPITHLDFSHLFKDDDSEETLQKGEQIILHPLASITLPTLISLNLG